MTRSLYLNRGELARYIAKPHPHTGERGGSAHPSRVAGFITKHGLVSHVLGAEALVLRSDVDAVLRGEQPSEQSPAPSMIPLIEIAKRLCVCKSSARKWLARNNVPIFRPHRVVALVPRDLFERALAAAITYPTPVRKHRRQNLPPWVRSTGQKVAQKKAARASSEYHAAVREGRKPTPKVEPLSGDAKGARIKQVTAWAKGARVAQKAGRALPMLPEIDRSPAPHRVEKIELDKREPQPIAQPKSTRRGAL